MTVPSRTELARLLGDEALAAEARFLQATTAWQSLRLLDRLGAEGPASTGDLARALDADMVDVRDRLEALADVGVVERTDDDRWRLTADRLEVDVDLAGGAEVAHRLGPAPGGGELDGASEDGAPEEASGAPGEPAADDADADADDAAGPFARLGRRVDAVLFG